MSERIQLLITIICVATGVAVASYFNSERQLENSKINAAIVYSCMEQLNISLLDKNNAPDLCDRCGLDPKHEDVYERCLDRATPGLERHPSTKLKIDLTPYFTDEAIANHNETFRGQIEIGDTAINHDTGETIMWNGIEWVPHQINAASTH